MSKEYKWPHLEDDSNRGLRIGTMLYPYMYGLRQLNGGKWARILDMNCGYAPAYETMMGTINDYTGFDSHKPCIDFLEKQYPKGKWVYSSDEKFRYEYGGVDMLMYLGIGNSVRDWESKTDVETFERLLKELSPKVVVLEVTEETGQDNWNNLVNSLGSNYYLDFKATFKTDLKHCALRKLRVHLRDDQRGNFFKSK